MTISRTRLLLSSLLLILAAILNAADPAGTIAGTVTDPTGAAILGAKVRAVNPSTGLTRETTTMPTAVMSFL
jgi:hypothetical protein